MFKIGGMESGMKEESEKQVTMVPGRYQVNLGFKLML